MVHMKAVICRCDVTVSLITFNFTEVELCFSIILMFTAKQVTDLISVQGAISNLHQYEAHTRKNLGTVWSKLQTHE